MRSGLLLLLPIALLVACGSKGDPKVTREQCSQVADHIMSLLIEHNTAHPDELWDTVHSEPGDTGIPSNVTKETLKDWIATPEGKTWLLQLQGAARTKAEERIDPCVRKATPKQVACLLAAKSKQDVEACDPKK